MKISKTRIKGCFVIEPKIFKDHRGHFLESFNQKKFEEVTGIAVRFIQDNQSWSHYGVLRGLHFQNAPHAQSKLVRVLSGRILDVAVDLRRESSTFGQQYSIELTRENNHQMFVPKGFAHGFVVLSEKAEVVYKCDEYYHP